jgi:hypothetical protein
MLNAIPIIGWLLSFVVTTSLAVPFWLVWTVFGIGETYFYWLPKVYLYPGFWSCVGLFLAIGILKAVLVPKFAYVSNTNENK